MSPETWGLSSNIIGNIMSKYTKVFFSVAVVCQIILLAVLNDSKVANNTYNIEFSTLFTIIMCSVASMLYIFVGLASYNQDKQFANIK
jgi:Ni/Fe-hydrogenase subunit HybB-like protein